MAGQTLNDRTTDATMKPAIIDHLMPRAISKNSEVKRSISWDFCLQSWRANWLNAIAYHTNNLLHSAHTYTQTHTSLKYSDAQLKKIIK